MASSGGKSKNQDPVLDELDELFPKVYNKPQEATTRSINDSLNNSKKSSPQSSTQKDAVQGLSSALDGVLDARMLKNALVAEQLKQQRGFSIEPTSGGKRAEANVTLDPKAKTLRKSPSPDQITVKNQLQVTSGPEIAKIAERENSKKKKKGEAAAKKNESKQAKQRK